MNALSLIPAFSRYHLLRHFRPIPPTELLINVTYRCNSRCQMCNIWQMDSDNEMTLAEWETILTKDAIFKEVVHLSIAGGEPTLHPELSSLAKLFLDGMPKLQLLSFVTHGFHTGRVLSFTDETAAICEQRGIKLSITVSLDGVGKTHDKLRGIPLAFNRTSATLLSLKSLQQRRRFSLGAAGVICRENLRDIREAQKWCDQHAIPFSYQLVGFHDTYVQNVDTRETLDFAPEDKDYLHALLDELASDRNWRNPRSLLKSYYWNDMLAMYKGENPRSTPCPFAADAFVVDCIGDVYYCLSEDKIGNFRHGRSVSDIYYDPKNLATRRRRSKGVCLGCNSGCLVTSGLAKNLVKFVWYFATGKRGPVGVL